MDPGKESHGKRIPTHESDRKRDTSDAKERMETMP